MDKIEHVYPLSIDWGMGLTNIDHAGIRYGVISANAVEYWYESGEAQYSPPGCGYCGETLPEGTDMDQTVITCERCGKESSPEECYAEDPTGYTYDKDGYQITQSYGDPDLFVILSPYYTLCNFCSPCAPGAGYLTSAGNVKAYCLGHDWFDTIAPYAVYNVADNTLVTVEASA